MDRKRLAAAILLSLGLHAAVLVLVGALQRPADDEPAAARPILAVGLRAASRGEAAPPPDEADDASTTPLPTKPAVNPGTDGAPAPRPEDAPEFPVVPKTEGGHQAGVSDPDTLSGAQAATGGPAVDRSPVGAGSPIPASPVGAVPRAPEPLEPVRPRYPTMARRMGLEGTVVLEVLVTADGRPSSCRAVGPRAHRLLEDAAVEAAMAVNYRPGTDGDDPVDDVLRLRVVFRLEA